MSFLDALHAIDEPAYDSRWNTTEATVRRSHGRLTKASFYRDVAFVLGPSAADAIDFDA